MDVFVDDCYSLVVFMRHSEIRTTRCCVTHLRKSIKLLAKLCVYKEAELKYIK